MNTRILQIGLMVALAAAPLGRAESSPEQAFGKQLPGSTEHVQLWWASSGWKIGMDKAVPQAHSNAILISAARDEAEAAQVVIRPDRPLMDVSVQVTDLRGPGQSVIESRHVDLLRVDYVHVTHPTDDSSVAGFWPDPLPPWEDGVTVSAHKNQPVWIRVHVPRDLSAGLYRGTLQIRAGDFKAAVPLHVTVYDFTLP